MPQATPPYETALAQIRSPQRESNPRPQGRESGALPTKLILVTTPRGAGTCSNVLKHSVLYGFLGDFAI
eukprot:45666-Prymnesium_polylepis.1